VVGVTLTHPSWKVGDLVTAVSQVPPDPSAVPEPEITGIVVKVDNVSDAEQVPLFPLVSVYNFSTMDVRRIYSYNLQILSVAR